MYLSTSTSTEDFPEMYLSTFQVLYKLYLSTDIFKYKVLLPGSGVTPACLYGTETLALTELQQQRLQVCLNNWVRKIAKSNEGRQAKNGGVKGRDGSAEELDRETGEEQITVAWTRRKDGG